MCVCVEGSVVEERLDSERHVDSTYTKPSP